MTTTELYNAITARLDELEAMEREADKAPWIEDGYDIVFDSGTAVETSLSTYNVPLICTARNLLPLQIAYYRRASKKAYAEYMAFEHLHKRATGMEFVRLTDRSEEALRGLHSIARALGIEVEP